eukprot:TRINITY_DN1181_c0_g1_i2.p1 TRINITY_DN1181_c0_g1~~TRINITY_DN1181_c0_g1_i2.p1  ORF type:complete len:1360 (+),score=378.76 TRINITY_DN1181_c0_g1_i2:1034-5113(+)
MTVADCDFVGNTFAAPSVAGAVAANGQQATLLVQGCDFVSNTVLGLATTQLDAAAAGGVNAGTSQYTIVQNSTFVNNTVFSGYQTGGAALYATNANLQVDGCVFWGNAAVTSAFPTTLLGDSLARGGAVYGEVPASITNCVFVNNLVSALGIARGGAMYMAYATTMSNLNFTNNFAYSPEIAEGGALYLDMPSGETVLQNSNFSCNGVGNSAFGAGSVQVFSPTVVLSSAQYAHGGALWVRGLAISQDTASIQVQVNVSNCMFWQNAAFGTIEAYGGGIAAVANAQTALGPVDSELHFDNVAVIDNTVMTLENNADGGGMYLLVGSVDAAASLSGMQFSYNDVVCNDGLECLGGGFYSINLSPDGPITLSQSVFTGNTAFWGAGWFAQTLPADSVVSGVRFENNRAAVGAGLFLEFARGLFTDCALVNNVATVDAGGLMSVGSAPTFVNTLFDGNSATSHGGAMLVMLDSQSDVIDQCTFTNNQANLGGAIHVQSSGTLSLRSSMFLNNSAVQDGGAIYMAGNKYITNCTFIGNSALGYGGAVVAASLRVLPINNCSFISNSALFGGGVAQIVGNLNVSYSRFQGNSATQVGGGLATVTANSVSVLGSNFVGNQAPSAGGIYVASTQRPVVIQTSSFTQNAATDIGGAIYAAVSTTVKLVGTTVSWNTALLGAGVATDATSTLELFQSVITTNSASGAGGGVYWSGTGGQPMCQGCTVSDNYAVYGFDYATPPVSANLVTVPRVIKQPASGTYLSFSVQLLDAYGHVTVYSTQTITAYLTQVPSCLRGDTEKRALSGIAVFNDTVLGAPGMPYTLQWQTTAGLATTPLQFQIGNCSVGSIPDGGECATCTQCPPGSYSVTSGATSCQTCNPSIMACNGAFAAAVQGYFVLFDPVAVEAKSYQCATAQCSGVQCVNQYGAPCQSIFSTTPYTCVNRNTSESTGLIAVGETGFVTDYCYTINQCAAGRAGFMCGQCQPGFGYWGNQCVDCTQPDKWLIPVLLLLNWAYVAFMHVLLSFQGNALSRSIIYFAQATDIVLGPVYLVQVWLSILNVRATGGSHCLFLADYFDQYTNSMAMPVISLVQLALTYIIISIASKVRTQQWANASRWFIRPLFSLMLSVYTPFSVAAMEALSCREVSGYSVLTKAPAVLCEGARYTPLRVGSIIVLIVVVVGFPLFVLVLLRAMRDKLAGKDFMQRYGFLYEPYKTDCQWWEVMVMVRRTALAALSLIIDTSTRSYILTVACFAIFAGQVWFKPFRSNLANYAEYIMLTAVIFLSFTRASSEFEESVFGINVFVGLVTALIVAFLLCVMLYLTKSIIRRWYFEVTGRPIADDDAEELKDDDEVDGQVSVITADIDSRRL